MKQLLKWRRKRDSIFDITGLACYYKQDVPPWYAQADEKLRWEVQARFWEAMAEVCKDSDAIFSYDLMNEPIVTGPKEKGYLGFEEFVGRDIFAGPHPRTGRPASPNRSPSPG